jgi:hypothetical protein
MKAFLFEKYAKYSKKNENKEMSTIFLRVFNKNDSWIKR